MGSVCGILGPESRAIPHGLGSRRRPAAENTRESLKHLALGLKLSFLGARFAAVGAEHRQLRHELHLGDDRQQRAKSRVWVLRVRAKRSSVPRRKGLGQASFKSSPGSFPNGGSRNLYASMRIR